jgi:hypothetical protein
VNGSFFGPTVRPLFARGAGALRGGIRAIERRRLAPAYTSRLLKKSFCAVVAM